MPEFFRSALENATPVNWVDVTLRLGAAVILGLGVAGVYRFTRPKSLVTPSFPVTLVLLSALIAMVTQVIGDNVARAFSLVGALSIVRFRTVVRDTEDTAFVIFSVALGMAVGARDIIVALAGLGVIGVTVFLMKPRRAIGPADDAQYRVTLRVGLGHDVEALVTPVLDAHMSRRQLVSIGTVKQGIAVEVAYTGLLDDKIKPESLVKALNRLEGIQSVDLARQTAASGPDLW